MAELIDLGLVREGYRVLENLLAKRGIRWFLATEGARLMALDKSKIDLVIRAARKARERKGHEVPEAAVAHGRSMIRRELIQRVAIAMLRTGC